MCIQDLICCCCGGVAIVLLGGFASFGEDPQVPVSVELMLSGDDSDIGTAGQQLISSEEDWVALWARHLGPDAKDPETGEVAPAAPDVDFDKQLVVAVFVGRAVTARGLTLISYTSDDQLTIRYDVRSYQTASSRRPSSDPEQAKRDYYERFGHIRAFGFFLISRSEREIVLLNDVSGFQQPEPKWREVARFKPPALQPAER